MMTIPEYQAYTTELLKTIDELEDKISQLKADKEKTFTTCGIIISEYNQLKGKVEAYENILFRRDLNANRSK